MEYNSHAPNQLSEHNERLTKIEQRISGIREEMHKRFSALQVQPKKWTDNLPDVRYVMDLDGNDPDVRPQIHF